MHLDAGNTAAPEEKSCLTSSTFDDVSYKVNSVLRIQKLVLEKLIKAHDMNPVHPKPKWRARCRLPKYAIRSCCRSVIFKIGDLTFSSKC